MFSWLSLSSGVLFHYHVDEDLSLTKGNLFRLNFSATEVDDANAGF